MPASGSYAEAFVEGAASQREVAKAKFGPDWAKIGAVSAEFCLETAKCCQDLATLGAMPAGDCPKIGQVWPGFDQNWGWRRWALAPEFRSGPRLVDTQGGRASRTLSVGLALGARPGTLGMEVRGAFSRLTMPDGLARSHRARHLPDPASEEQGLAVGSLRNGRARRGVDQPLHRQCMDCADPEVVGEKEHPTAVHVDALILAQVAVEADALQREKF